MPNLVVLFAWAFGGFVYFAEDPEDLKPIWEFEFRDGHHDYCLDYQISPCGLALSGCQMGGPYRCDLATRLLGQIDPD